MSADPSSGGVLLFGGDTADGTSRQSWLWDGGDWTLQASAAGPPTRFFAPMAEHPPTGAVLMFGGHLFNGGPLLDDGWVWRHPSAPGDTP
jgi:hypothetical protein